MKWPRVFGKGIVWVSLIVAMGLTSSPVFAETAASSPAEVTAAKWPIPWIGSVLEGVAAPLAAMIPLSGAQEKSQEGQITVEGSEGVSLEVLRRRLHRYNDQDLPGRFVEVSTEPPPVFGSDP